MMRKTWKRIRVTQQDIEKGEKSQVDSCPIALAVNRAVKKGVSVSVGVARLDLWDWDHSASSSLLPEQAVEFIQKFDQSGPGVVRPLQFEVQVPVKFLKGRKA
jgi:hypothetical protein